MTVIYRRPLWTSDRYGRFYCTYLLMWIIATEYGYCFTLQIQTILFEFHCSEQRFVCCRGSKLNFNIGDSACDLWLLEPLSQSEVSSGDLELTQCKSTVKAICVGLANSANYPDQWSDATSIRCKLHCERGELFLSLLGVAAYAAVSRDFRSVLHLLSLSIYVLLWLCQSWQ